MPRIGTDTIAKLGRGVLTYSRAPLDTCPGASAWCAAACYAQGPYRRYPQSRARWDANGATSAVPALPQPRKDGARTLLRLHVSGDFDTAPYVHTWRRALEERPDVLAWGYTRSWRVPRLRKALDALRALPNVQLFASWDASMGDERPPEGWRVAYIHPAPVQAYACPEQDGRKADCASCRYCFDGRRGDVSFRVH